MRRHFQSLIVLQRQTRVRLGTIEHMAEATQRRFGTGPLILNTTVNRVVRSTSVLTVVGWYVCHLDEVDFPVPATRCSQSPGDLHGS